MSATRILLIELRRSASLWAALLIASLGVFVLFASQPPYRSFMQLVVVQRDILQLIWPLVLGAGAWQAYREHRSRVEELVDTTPRPRWSRVLPLAAAMAIGAGAAYVVMLAGAVSHLGRLDGYYSPGAFPLVALGVLSLVAAVWLGLAIGALLPSPLTAPMLVVTAFVALALLPAALFDQTTGRPGVMLLFPNLQGPRDGLTELQAFSTRANLIQTLWLAALAATGLALFAAARSGARLAAALPVVLAVAIAVPAMPGRIAAAWVEDRHATEVVCTSDAPVVCTARVYSYALDHLRDPARQALAALAVKLPPAPARVLMEIADKPSADPPPVDTLVVRFSGQDDPTLYKPDDLLWRMVGGAGVPECPDLAGDPNRTDPSAPDPEPVVRYLAARMAAAAWLLDRELQPAGKDPLVASAIEALDALHAQPADVQRARITAYRDAERACATGDRLQLLTGNPR